MSEHERVVVVTGAASGIGRATAELFAERGWGVVAVDLKADALSWADGQDGLVTYAGDVSTEAANIGMVEAATSSFGRLDAAVLNAGIVGSPPIEADGAVERLDQILAVNVKGVMLGIRAAAPALRASGGGAVVATASTSGIRADPGSWAYNASKAAVINLVRAAALDYATQDIRVNAVAPGPTETGMTTPLKDSDAGAGVYESIRSRVPMQRFGAPRELAEVIWFLASPAASFVTGVTIPVDGGISANAGHFPPGGRTPAPFGLSPTKEQPAMPIKDYEDVTVYGLDANREQQLIEQQNECTFVWSTKDGSPMAVIMSYFEDGGKFWMTASGQRKRIPAIRRDPRVAIVITSPGTSMGGGKTVTYKGTARVLDDDETKAWFYPRLAERLMAKWGPERVHEFAKMLDSPRRVIIEITPTLRVGYDGDKMAKATMEAREAGALQWVD